MSEEPLATHEVRWFFEGAVAEHPALKTWFETTAPLPRSASVGPPRWEGRLGDEPDVYLLFRPTMGIKWREHNLQIKGQVAALGPQVFCARFEGNVERWLKWSYAGLHESYRQMIVEAHRLGVVTRSVRKTRALRKVRLSASTTEAEEVDAKTRVERGVGVELTDIVLDGRAYCSLAFEAFPDDTAMAGAFTRTVEGFLEGAQGFALAADRSLSYPAWLGRS